MCRTGKLRHVTSKPTGQTHCVEDATLASATGISTTRVHRYMSLFGHAAASFEVASSSWTRSVALLEKVRDVVGLYLNPPDNALVLCVDAEEPRGPSCSSVRSRCCPWELEATSNGVTP